MTEHLLTVELDLPFRWERRDLHGHALATLLQGNRLLLQAAAFMEPRPLREVDEDKATERLDAKLDLILHLLAMSLNQGQPTAQPTRLRLTPEGIAWETAEALPAPGDSLLLALTVGALPIPLQLPVQVASASYGWVHTRFIQLDDALADLWQQWLFRQHRRAVHAAREGG